MHPSKIFLISILFSWFFAACNNTSDLKPSSILKNIGQDDSSDKSSESSGANVTGSGEDGTIGSAPKNLLDGGEIPQPILIAGPIPLPLPEVTPPPSPSPSPSPTPSPTPVVEISTPTPTPPPVVIPQPVLHCQFDRVALNPGQTSTISWTMEDAPAVLPALRFYLDSSQSQVSWGSITQTGNLEVRYQAPSQVLQEFEVRVIAEAVIPNYPTLVPAPCTVRLSRGGDLGVPDDGLTRGLVGEVYEVGNINVLPNFNSLVSVQTIVSPNLDIPVHAFTEGFPGVRDLYEWFAIRFRGRIIVPNNQVYTFRIISDDGSKLFIDNQLVINNDGVHAIITKDGNISLAAGIHDIEIQYFQGPRYHIALQLFWKNSAGSFVIIPPDNFRRPL